MEAGAYDPSIATIYYQETEREKGEPKQTAVQLCKTFIRFPYMARTGFETPVAKQMLSAGQVIIRVRYNNVTATIKPAMEIHHRGTVYGVISPSPIMDRSELEFLCQYQTKSEIVEA